MQPSSKLEEFSDAMSVGSVEATSPLAASGAIASFSDAMSVGSVEALWHRFLTWAARPGEFSDAMSVGSVEATWSWK